MQKDGNFVLYNDENKAVWSPRTDNNPGSKLMFGDSCNIAIKSAGGKTIWESHNTCGKSL